MGQRKTIHHILFAAYFSASMIYLEVVFRIATVGAVWSIGFLYTLLFSVAYSTVGYLLSSLSKKPTVNRVVASVLLFVTALVYIVQFLVFKQFKQFYDINTMTGGAGDMLTSYFAELIDLIFRQGGIFVVLVMLVPFALYLFVSGKWIPACGSRLGVRIVTVVTALAVYILTVALILVNPVYRPMYHGQYNFQSAVSNFGLVTGLRLDLQNNLSKPEYSFEAMPIPDDTQTEATQDTSDQTEIPTETTEPTQPVIVYGDNQLDIDFEKLDQSASSAEKKLNNYVSSMTATKQNEYTGLFEGKNLIMITAEAFSAEIIDPELTPTLYRLANNGIQFADYYQPSSAGTTGGEYQNIFGLLPTKGGMSFKKTANHLNYFTMGSQLDRLGYYGKAFHNNSYTYYSRNKTHINLGYSDGFMGYGNGMEEYVKNSWPQSDYEMISGTLPTYIDKQPFNVYYMSVSGHSGYTRSGNTMTNRHWDRVQHLPYSNTVKGYIAASLDLEDGLTHLISGLEAKGIADDTVICISSDHFPYGLDSDATLGDMPYLSELYGYDVDTTFERDHSRLILWSGCLEKMDPIVVDTPTFSLDILPTLSNLFGTEFDSRLMPGRDVFSDASALVFNINYDWKTELGTYYSSTGKFVPSVDPAQIPEDYVETIKAIVRNKITYCSGVLDTDYFRHLFG